MSVYVRRRCMQYLRTMTKSPLGFNCAPMTCDQVLVLVMPNVFAVVT